MADITKKVANSVDGDFFVDTTCINCDTCRQLAPKVFADGGDYSFVYSQPGGEEEARAAHHALLSCPTASIGFLGRGSSASFVAEFPLKLDENVFYCGFNSHKSFGANSYLLQRKSGNWLIDSPRYNNHLVSRFEEMGGLKYIFLTHQDDVADASLYAEKFGAKRIIHQADSRAVPDAEVIIRGEDEVVLEPGFRIIPVPGHTRGHCLLLVEDEFLFTGDHLAWDPAANKLIAFDSACWYSWSEQTKSMKKLLELEFAWVLAGHGDRVRLEPPVMQTKLRELVGWMESVRGRR